MIAKESVLGMTSRKLDQRAEVRALIERNSKKKEREGARQNRHKKTRTKNNANKTDELSL